MSVAKREGLGLLGASTTRLCCGSSTLAEAKAAKASTKSGRDMVRPLRAQLPTERIEMRQCCNECDSSDTFESRGWRQLGEKSAFEYMMRWERPVAW